MTGEQRAAYDDAVDYLRQQERRAQQASDAIAACRAMEIKCEAAEAALLAQVRHYGRLVQAAKTRLDGIVESFEGAQAA